MKFILSTTIPTIDKYFWDEENKEKEDEKKEEKEMKQNEEKEKKGVKQNEEKEKKEQKEKS